MKIFIAILLFPLSLIGFILGILLRPVFNGAYTGYYLRELMMLRKYNKLLAQVKKDFQNVGEENS